MVSELSILAGDGYKLAATVYTPETSNGRAVVVNSAMGVKRGYYHKYATFLASRGFAVLTYDYRGVGGSRPASLRGSTIRLRDWGMHDQTAAIGWMREQYPHDKLLIVSHSVGGQILGLTPQNQYVAGMLGVASQSGYWQGWPGWRKWYMFAVWHILIPGLTLIGYFPASKVGLGEDLPAGVAREWARGGRNPRYILGFFGGTADDHYANFKGIFRSYSIEDDTFAPEQSVDALIPFYPNARSERLHVKPADLGVNAIGHFGFFREKFADMLWVESADWLAQV